MVEIISEDFERFRLREPEELLEFTNNHAPVSPPTPEHTYSVRVLHRDRPEDWHWHPYAMARIMRFCEEHERQADPGALRRNLLQSFVIDVPGLIVVAYFRDDQLIGHMLCDRAILYFRPIITVHQYALDHSVPDETRQEAVDLVKAWGKTFVDAEGNPDPPEFIQWLARNKALVRLYKRAPFNGKAHMALIRTTLED